VRDFEPYLRDVINRGVNRKVSNTELARLLDELQKFFREMPSRVWEEEEGAVGMVIGWVGALPVDRSAPVVELAGEVGEWLIGYFQYVFINIHDIPSFNIRI
jgi:hypothetical protein